MSDSDLKSIGLSNRDIRNVKNIKENRVVLRDLIKGVNSDSDDKIISSNLSLYGDKIDLFGSAVSSSSGADIDIIANELNVRKKSGIWSVSSINGVGGDISVQADNIILELW